MPSPATQSSEGGEALAPQALNPSSKGTEKKDNRKSLSTSTRTREDALKAFRVPARYSVRDVLGQGAYGIVVSAFDSERKEMLAVKKIERVFDHETFTKRTLREIRVLKNLKHENIISMKTVFANAKAKNDFDDLYIVFELMDTDLANIIKSPQPLTMHHIQFFVYQILRGLKFLHSAGIIHRDIKPRNLLVNSNCDLKICDMGLARFNTGQLKHAPPMTDYIATRWYRAPEIILQWEGYGKPIDLWSVGCILAELIGRKPIFPGNEADHQITLICDVLGRPPPALVQRCPHQETIDFLEALPRKPAHPLHHVYRTANADVVAIDLLTRLLKFDPEKRLTVEECLKHPYLSQLHCPADEPESPPMDLLIDFPFDAVKRMPAEQLMNLVVHDIETCGTFYIDPSLQEDEDRRNNEPRPPTDSPPPNSPPPPSHPPALSPSAAKFTASKSMAAAAAVDKGVKSPDLNGLVTSPDGKATGAMKLSTSAKKQAHQREVKATTTEELLASKLSPRAIAKATGKSSHRSAQRPLAMTKPIGGPDYTDSPLILNSPIFESSQDSTLHPPTPTPSTPSNVSTELLRLGAAVDELRAM